MSESDTRSLLEKKLREIPIGTFRRVPSFKTVCDQHKNVTFRTLEASIYRIQKNQETIGELQNPRRLEVALNVFRNLDLAWQEFQDGDDDVFGDLWGSMFFILNKTANEDKDALDAIFDAYEKIGSTVTSLQDSAKAHDMIKRPHLHVCLESMCSDLFSFHGDVVELMTFAGWRNTFKANWKAYSEGNLLTILANFKGQAEVLESFDKLLSDELKVLSELVKKQGHRMTVTEASLQRLLELVCEHGSIMCEAEAKQHEFREEIRDFLSSANGNDVLVSVELQNLVRQPLMQLADGLKDLTEEYHKDREDRKAKDALSSRNRKQDQLKKVHDWIAAPRVLQAEYHSIHQRTREQYPATTAWILKHHVVWNWMKDIVTDNPVIQINGKKGTGKTVLASAIIDACREMNEPRSSTSYFYFKELDSGQNTCMAMCRSLLHQMLQGCQETLPSFEKDRHGELQLGTESKARSLMNIVCDRGVRQFLIVDGLDECVAEERQQVLQILKSLVEQYETSDPGRVRVLLVGTFDSGMQSQKGMQAIPVVQVDNVSNAEDIGSFARANGARLKGKFVGMYDNEVERMVTRLCQNSQGMFLYAKLVVENLMAQSSLQDVLSQLEDSTFPTGLKEAYKANLANLSKKDTRPWEKTKKILGWLAGAKRPLMWHELQAALSITSEADMDGPVNYRLHKLPEEASIFTICGSFVQVIHGNRIEFAHPTARSFILSSNTPGLTEEAIEYNLTILCMRYLSFSLFNKDLSELLRNSHIEKGSYSFADYAVSKWHRHFESLVSLANQGRDVVREMSRNGGRELLTVLHNFLDRYAACMRNAEQQSVRDGRAGTENAITHAKERIQVFSDVPGFENFQRVWCHIALHERKPIKERSKISLDDLAEALQKIRAKIADIHHHYPPRADDSQEMTKHDLMVKYYGRSLHKCERVTCDLFYDGFTKEQDLKRHVKRHDRPFECPVPTCHQAHWSFVNQKDRDKHIATYHPELSEGPSEFTTLERRSNTEAYKHRCDFEGCTRSFTRRSNLVAHKMNHMGERPHACMTCGRAFTRANDLARHDRAKHVRRR